MTDKLSERAEQLLTDLFKKCYSGQEAKSFRHAMRREFTPMLVAWAESLVASKRELGVAAERGAGLADAAERAKRWLKLNSPLSFKPELVASLEADILSGEDGDWLRKHDAELRARMTEQFQSYTIEHAASHDAEVAMAATIEEIEVLLDVIARESDDKLTIEAQRLKKALNTAVDRRVAEIERRTRLDEHMISCHRCSRPMQPSMEGPRDNGCGRRRELAAALAESQPVSAKEIEGLQNMPDSGIDTSDVPEVTDWSKAERGKFYRGPAQAKEGEKP